jgi:hypothetical protein
MPFSAAAAHQVTVEATEWEARDGDRVRKNVGGRPFAPKSIVAVTKTFGDTREIRRRNDDVAGRTGARDSP